MPEELIEYVTTYAGRDDGGPWTEEQAATGAGKPVYDPDGEQQLGELTMLQVSDGGKLVVVYALQQERDGRLALEYDDEKIIHARLMEPAFPVASV